MMCNGKPAPPSMYLPCGYVPIATDIMCGRGKASTQHKGNKIFLSHIRASLKDYKDAASRIDRSVVVSCVVKTLFEGGMRFLKLEKERNQYIVLSRELAHSKVGHCLRDVLKYTGNEVGSTKKKSSTRKRPGGGGEFSSSDDSTTNIREERSLSRGTHNTLSALSNAISCPISNSDDRATKKRGPQQDDNKKVLTSKRMRAAGTSNQLAKSVFSFSDNVGLESSDSSGELEKIRPDSNDEKTKRSAAAAAETEKTTIMDTAERRRASKLTAHVNFKMDEWANDLFLDGAMTSDCSPLPMESTFHFDSQDVEHLLDALR